MKKGLEAQELGLKKIWNDDSFSKLHESFFDFIKTRKCQYNTIQLI